MEIFLESPLHLNSELQMNKTGPNFLHAVPKTTPKVP